LTEAIVAAHLRLDIMPELVEEAAALVDEAPSLDPHGMGAKMVSLKIGELLAAVRSPLS
jgi:hypothetical protein